ncbi:OLC1v1011757C1 [Oldenlandia corymbosa var. corymbosa]|uniref:GPI inositol-deacylase n=1 Tax=Oldenlandia corymbosa var. corymbosa TaxID=529605 RepID=A0AAV1DUY4_OLDCO|nr:OLC1v1011757C1 [Oldenlandia corymbosa var. corymbosa]
MVGGLKGKLRLAGAVLLGLCIGFAGVFHLLKPISNGCVMTYMYPTYIPISIVNATSVTSSSSTSIKYGLFLYHEGWKRIDFNDHLKNLNGIPLLFIPGNGGSYKQVRSLAAESDRAYQGGPFEPNYYQQAIHNLEKEGGADVDVPLPSEYSRMLDWFAVDLEGEHSAMDARILEEHSNHVVYAIHRILDLYKESHNSRIKEGAASPSSQPKSVVLVGHSMGGFVARAAIIHPDLRKSAVETVLTLSTPHQSPPLPLQPSLGRFYASVNDQWRRGYLPQTSQSGHYLSEPLLSRVVVVSISGGYNDYQVRSNLESLDGIVPPTHGFTISSTGMKNVWLSMEHQVILWCNQLVVQVSHTLLSLIDYESGQLFSDVQSRLAVFIKMLHSGISQNLNWSGQSLLPKQSIRVDSGSQMHQRFSCPSHIHWNDDGLEKDLYIQTTSITVLAMDGRRRWLDIQKLGSNGTNHFVFVTNLAPCSGVRIHLWPEKEVSSSDTTLHSRVVEVTSKMMHIPSGPAPRQTEPGSQTEQAPPSAVFWLDPDDMRGFRFITISVAPRQTLSGRPPPATSMGVGHFFSTKEGEKIVSPWMLLHSMFSEKELILKEDHPLAFSLTFSVSLGLLPVMFSIKTTGCGIKKLEFPLEDPGESETNRLCKLRCFPPVGLAWDSTSGLHIFPNLYSETLVVDSSPALWTSTQWSEKTSVLLLVDPHCSYKAHLAVSVSAAAGRFLLLYFPQIVGLTFAVAYFAMMRQAYASELDMPIPTVLSAVESNMRMLLPFFFMAILPILVAFFFSSLSSSSIPPFWSFGIVSVICYLFANGAVILLVLISTLGLYTTAAVHIFIKKRWQAWEPIFPFFFLHWFLKLSTNFLSFKVVRIIRTNPLAISALVSCTLICFMHPALGLIVLLCSQAICCHNSLCSSLMASFRSHSGSKQSIESSAGPNGASMQFMSKYGGKTKLLPRDESNCSSPDSARSFAETQLEIFHHRHGLLTLHLLASTMFVPSMVAWFQRIGSDQNFPWFWDSALCIGVVLHGISNSKPEFNFFFPAPGISGWEIRLSFAYLVAGYLSYFTGLALAPYKVFYPMAAIGVVSFAFRIIQRRSNRGRKHSHRH